jgi:hypothetical protein
MKRFTLFLTLALFTINPVQASYKQLLELCSTMDFSHYSQGLKNMVKNSPENGQSYTMKLLLRSELCPGYWQDLRRVEYLKSDTANPVSFTIQVYLLKILRQANQILYFKLEEINPKNNKVLNFWNNKKILGMDSMANAYRSFYQTALVKSHLFEYGPVYGLNCGIHGHAPKLRSRQQDMIINNDTKQLLVWLRSAVIEKQVYALEGLLELKREGQVLDKNVLIAIEFLKIKEGDIMYCDGNKKRLVSINHVVLPIFKKFEID